MKKISAILLTLAMLTGLCAVVVSAEGDYRQDGEFWMFDAPKTEEILCMGAGLDSVEWKVPYLTEKPTIDGTIGEDEYRRFENFEDYLTLMAPISGTTEEEFDTFRINAEFFGGDAGFVTPYWGWDGEYLYMAFVVQNLNGFYCNPQESLYLFTQNCLQIGIGDEFISGNNYTELGFGVNSETGELITHTWLGTYQTKKTTDYIGHYNDESGIVTYELRIKLSDTVGREYPDGQEVAAGDIFKMAWLLSVNGKGNRLDANGNPTSGEEWQVGFCHGIGGPFSYKASEYFAYLTLGAPGETDAPAPEESETAVGNAESESDAGEETLPESAPIDETVNETLGETADETIGDLTGETADEIAGETAEDTNRETVGETLGETSDETDILPAPDTTAESETAAVVTETQAADQGGCGSALGIGIAALTLPVAGAALLRSRKKEN